MHTEDANCPYSFSVQELEDGYAIQIKGDKEKLKAKLDALEAYHNFRQKAKAAGFGHCNSHAGSHGFLGLLHKHIKAFHGHCHSNKENKPQE